MVKTKPKIQNVLIKETSGIKTTSSGVRTGPRPTYGHEIQPSKSKETIPKPVESMKNINENLAFLRRHKVPKGNYIKGAGRSNRSGRCRARKHDRGEGCSRRFNKAGEGAQEGGGGPEGGVGADVKDPLKVAGPRRRLSCAVEDDVLKGLRGGLAAVSRWCGHRSPRTDGRGGSFCRISSGGGGPWKTCQGP